MKVFKKSLAVLLAALMLFSVAAVVSVAAADETPAETTSWYVAGTENLCGVAWKENAEENLLTAGEDGIFTKTYKDLGEGTYEFKVTNGTWDEAYGDGNNNVVFVVSAKTDVTIKFNAETKEVSFEGENAAAPATLEIASITAVGTGKNGFLNDLEWKEAAAENHLEGKDGVYTITYKDVQPGSYQVKFAANDAWTDSWGVKKADDTAEYPENAAVYNGDNITFDVEAISNVTLTFDASKFDYSTKLGATYEIKVEATGATVDPSEAPTIVAGYYLTGSEGLFGTEWKNAADENTLLTKAADGTYYRDFTNIAAGEYSFKAIYVNARGDVFWHPDGMGNDVKVTVATDGSTVRIVYAPFTTLDSGKIYEFEPEKQYGQDSPDTATATVYAPGETVPTLEPWTEPTTVVTEPTTTPTEPTTAAQTVKKSANTLKVTAKTVTAKAKTLKSKKVAKKALTISKPKGTVTVKITKATKNGKKFSAKKFTITKKGKLTIKKGVKKGNYKVKVSVTAKGTSKYNKKTVSKTITVKVK